MSTKKTIQKLQQELGELIDKTGWNIILFIKIIMHIKL